MSYLLISNIGVAPSEGFTLIGVSTTRNAGCAGTIGQFGSGTKFAINYLLRNNIKFYVFCGKLRIEFTTKVKTVNDGLRSEEFNQVIARLDCSEPSNQIHKTLPLSWTTEHGLNWDLPMALREFIANALDRTIREGKKVSDISIEIVKDNQVRAKDGHTRIFIEFTEEVAKYYAQMDKRFLHFKEEEKITKNQIIPKAARELSKLQTTPAVIYKGGVYVREKIGNYPAMFDYNINNLELDESRNAEDWAVTAHMSILIAREENATRRAKILTAVLKGEEWQETNELSNYQLARLAELPAVKENWLKTWKDVTPENSILNTSMEELATHIKKKGHHPIKIASSIWQDFLVKCGIPTETSILNDAEKQGITELPASQTVIEALNDIWQMLEELHLLNGKSKPKVCLFEKIMDGESSMLGYYSNNVVHIHQSIADGKSSVLWETILEELTHHITGSTDMSRDMQDYLLRLSIKLWRRNK